MSGHPLMHRVLTAAAASCIAVTGASHGAGSGDAVSRAYTMAVPRGPRQAVSRAYTLAAPPPVHSVVSRAFTLAPPPVQRVAHSRALTLKYCAGDTNGDLNVAVGDLLAVLAEWGTPGTCTDFDGDGMVAVGDLLIVLAAWGPCP